MCLAQDLSLMGERLRNDRLAPKAVGRDVSCLLAGGRQRYPQNIWNIRFYDPVGMIDWLAFVRSIHIAASILLAAVLAFPLIVLKPGQVFREDFSAPVTGPKNRIGANSKIKCLPPF